jgi:hypothetical protein
MMPNHPDDVDAKNRANRPSGPSYSDDIDSILVRNRARNPPLRTDEIVRIITRANPIRWFASWPKNGVKSWEFRQRNSSGWLVLAHSSPQAL